MEVVQAVPKSSAIAPSIRDFADCRNIESGAVFIIASGASAKDFPIERFAHVPMITMNGAISMFVGTGIKPCFYACTDKSFSLQQPDLYAQAMAMSQRVALWEEQVRDNQLKPAGEVYLLKKAPKPTWRDLLASSDKELVRARAFSGRNKYLGFSKNMQKGFFDARTVTYLALQIACHLGFSKVFLVGVDLNQNAGRFYENKNSNRSPCGLDQHFDSRILPSFSLMAEQVVSSEFAVYNLSASSRLPQSVVPFMSLAQVEATVGSSPVTSQVPKAQ